MVGDNLLSTLRSGEFADRHDLQSESRTYIFPMQSMDRQNGHIVKQE